METFPVKILYQNKKKEYKCWDDRHILDTLWVWPPWMKPISMYNINKSEKNCETGAEINQN